eukprot:2697404-Pleurochrysis_carterae.AAC.3
MKASRLACENSLAAMPVPFPCATVWSCDHHSLLSESTAASERRAWPLSDWRRASPRRICR